MTEPLSFESFGKRLMQLLDEGRFVATYKFAVLLGLIEVLAETADTDGQAPPTVSTRALARKVIETYWPHTRIYGHPLQDGDVLRQNQAGQARILTLIDAFRSRTVGDIGSPLALARHRAPDEFEALVRAVEFKLIEMPLGRLQLIGSSNDPFIYTLPWAARPTQATVNSDDFDGRLDLLPGAGDHLLRAAPLFRPLIERTWALTVARWNKLPDAELQDFLFGSRRISLAPLAAGLREIAAGRCAYCRKPVPQHAGAQIDHFVPWSWHFDNSIENLVYAHSSCNNSKRAYLAAENHLEYWMTRINDATTRAQLAHLAAQKQWETSPDKTLSIVRSTYLNLDAGYKLWQHGKEFTSVDATRVRVLLT